MGDGVFAFQELNLESPASFPGSDFIFALGEIRVRPHLHFAAS